MFHLAHDTNASELSILSYLTHLSGKQGPVVIYDIIASTSDLMGLSHLCCCKTADMRPEQITRSVGVARESIIYFNLHE